MSRLAAMALKLVAGMLIFFGVILISLMIYYFPAIDRLYLHPCHYYPNAFIDCE